MKVSETKYCSCMYFASAALARKVERLAVECWKPTGLSPSHAYLLLLVMEKPGIQPMNLCTHLQLTPSTITRLIEKLEEKNLAFRVSEGKNTSVFPAEKADSLLPMMQSCQREFYEKSSLAMNNAECCELLGRMNRLSEELEK